MTTPRSREEIEKELRELENSLKTDEYYMEIRRELSRRTLINDQIKNLRDALTKKNPTDL